jgi:hypothetical protein
MTCQVKLHPFMYQFLLLVAGLLFIAACNPAATGEDTPTARPAEPSLEASPTPQPPDPSPTAAPTITPAAATATAIPPAASPTPGESTVIEDILYATAVDPDAQERLLDIYVPGSPGNYPVVLWAHGSNLDKASGKILGRLLSKNGFVAVTIDWQDDVDAQDKIGHFREAMENAECALRLIGSQAERYGGDPERVIWAGYSAGGWLGSLVSFGEGDLQALWDEYAATQEGPPRQVDCAEEAKPAQVTGLVASSTPFFSDFWLETDAVADSAYNLQELKAYTTIGHNPDLKVRLIHGEIDTPSITEGAELFFSALEEAGYDVAHYPQSGGHDPYYQQVIDQILALAEE